MNMGTVSHIARLLHQRSRNAMNAIVGHAINQKMAIHRAAEAKAWGLLPMDWMLPPKDWPTPFTQQTITINDGVRERGPWLKWLLATILLVMLSGGGFVVWPSVEHWLFATKTVEVEKILTGDADVEAGTPTVEHRE